MPVITFLQDGFMAFRGPYMRYVGTHTVNFCKRINRHKLPDGLRQTLVISTTSADEVVAALLKLDNRRDISAFSEITPRKKPKAKSVKFALKAYMSALLVIFGINKQQLLDIANKDEQEFINLWLDIYKYNNDDMVLFNNLLQGYQKGGLQGIAQILIDVMNGCVWEQPFAVQKEHLQFFAKNITEDVATILSQLSKLDLAEK